MLKLDLSRDAGAFIAGLPGKQFKQVVSAMLSLLKNPHPHDARPLSGMEGYFRVDSGEYRIVFRVTDDLLCVPLIGKRNDDEVYRRLGRKT
ncbi:MAG: hypothetical protein WC073_02000 [Sterolibacterium sp.]